MGPLLTNIIETIGSKNAVHGKKLRKSLSGLDKTFYDEAEQFFDTYKTYAESQNKSLEYGIDSYLRMVSDMMFEYIHFMKTGEYTCKSFEDANRKVYNNPNVMEYYMHGLLMSEFLWNHHHKMMKFFDEKLKAYSPKRYLEIGGGHGLFLSKAKKQFGSDTYFEMVDISESSLSMAKSFVGPTEAVYKLQDIYDYKLEESFDFITIGEVIEHVEDPVKLMKGVSALLADGGTIFMTTPTNAPAIDHIYLFRNEQEIVDVIEASGLYVKEKLSVYSEDVTPEYGEKFNIALLYGGFLGKKD